MRFPRKNNQVHFVLPLTFSIFAPENIAPEQIEANIYSLLINRQLK